MGLFESGALSTFPNPTIALVMPLTVLVNIGSDLSAFDANIL
jgi:hypothetical protein